MTFQESREAITIDQWTDSIYQATPPEIIISNVVSGRKMRIQKYNLSDTGIKLRRHYHFCIIR